MTRIRTFGGWGILVLAALVLGACVPAPGGAGPVPTEASSPHVPDLEAILRAPATVPVGDSVPLEFTLVNPGTAGRYVLRWYTPLEGFGGEILIVQRNGAPVAYEGPLAMRGDPTPADYVWLDAGASVSATLDLTTAYDMTEPGTYTIALIAPRISDVARTEAEMASSVDELGPIEVASNEVVVEITGSGGATRLPRAMKGYELYSCSTSDGGGWAYTLITGTNRDKAYQEVTAPGEIITEDGWVKITVMNQAALEALLDRLPHDTGVIWMDIGRLDGAPSDVEGLPPEAVVEAIVGHAVQRGLRLTVAQGQGR